MPGVALGGYLLQGGFGWNGRVHGPACMSVEAVDLVTADGELLRADARQDADLLWAARGSRPGFFAAVTGFHVRLQPRPRVVANALFTYPVECLEPVFTWAQEVATEVRRTTEMTSSSIAARTGEPEIVVTRTDARRRPRRGAGCPRGYSPRARVRSRARIEVPYIEATMADLYAGAHASYPDGSRYGVDNMWTHAPAAELMPLFDRIVETIPEAPSHMLWMNWGPGSEPAPARPDMAFSVEDDTYIALYGVWTDPADDAANVAWATDLMRAGEEHASGIQLADENLAERPARFIDEERMARLDALRDEWDPEGRFHPWMGRL